MDILFQARVFLLYFYFLAKDSPLCSLPAVTTKPAPAWNKDIKWEHGEHMKLFCAWLAVWERSGREGGRDDLAVFQHSSLLELCIATNHRTLDWTTISNGDMVHDDWINNLRLQSNSIQWLDTHVDKVKICCFLYECIKIKETYIQWPKQSTS